MLYKGYVVTKDKGSIEKIKGRKSFKTLSEVKNESEYAGVLADDIILIDVDDKEESDILYRIICDIDYPCQIYETTRGKHFLFQNTDVTRCATGAKLAVGLNADIKIGGKNTYEVIKFDGKKRKVLRANDEPGPLPVWLTPVKTTKKFRNMTDGDGRNSVFYSYIPVLQSNGISKEDIRQTVQLINDYVVAKPLPQSELETILRDEAFQMPIFYNGSTFLFNVFANYLMQEYHIKKINGQLHCYVDGVYRSGLGEIEALMIQKIPTLNQSKRREVLAYLDILIRENTRISSPNLIAFNNGVYNLENGVLSPYSPDYVITNKIPWDYNENAYESLLDATLDRLSCHDADVRANLEESVGYMMFRRNELGKAFVLTGDGSNGKSTWLNLLKSLIGDGNYSALDLKKLGDRFSTVMLFGKLANIGDDISSEYIADVAEFRKIVTGETIDAEQKGQAKFQFAPYAKLFFSSNSIPRMGKGKDFNAIKRRLIIIPFNAKFSKDDPDFVPYISDKLQTQASMEYLIQLGIRGLKRVLANKAFTESAVSRKELEAYEEMTNPLVGFIKDNADALVNENTKDVYKRYQIYCDENNLSSLGRKQFTAQLCKEMNVKSVQKRVNNRREQVFVYED